MPHSILGLGFSDWVAIFTLFGIGFAWLRGVIKDSARKATDDEIKELSQRLVQFTYDIKDLQNSINQLKRVTTRLGKLEESHSDLVERVIRLEEHIK
ncbi:hypothetical protein [Ligilactobacillus equi]|uniref:hypothetical protein n=1 Tax=Ligilactobacillus equi TaxID=137357 RepID=UPI0004689B23|nr:hypothetical protein [Ligilactobacillus equi]